MCIIFDEAEAAGSFLEAVKTHDDTFDLAASAFVLAGFWHRVCRGCMLSYLENSSWICSSVV